ncbi:MAG: DeoR/GlpR transcriptional regulator [Spirochaetales bacterium]|nr:DeoR/GlpR transcriptional regulator [Spirochaetales bacterium]
MGKVAAQQNIIFEWLQRKGQISLHEAIELLGVSESTVRRLFIGLEKNGRALRTYGGLQYIPDRQIEYSYDAVESRNVDKKQAIASCAVSFVENGATIYMDSGSTLSQFGGALASRLENGKLSNITIFTNSLINLHRLQKYGKILLIGGEFRENRKDFCGYLAEETLQNLHFSQCFLGSDGFNPSLGFTTTDFFTARLNEIVLNNSLESYVLMDSTKFSTSAIVSYTKKNLQGR